MNVIIASNDKEKLTEFRQGLESGAEVDLTWTESASATLEKAAEIKPELVIVSDDLTDMTGLELVGKLLLQNAFINTAVMTSLSEEDFHEASEGMGVLARLPNVPGADHAAELMSRLKEILALSTF